MLRGDDAPVLIDFHTLRRQSPLRIAQGAERHFKRPTYGLGDHRRAVGVPAAAAARGLAVTAHSYSTSSGRTADASTILGKFSASARTVEAADRAAT